MNHVNEEEPLSPNAIVLEKNPKTLFTLPRIIQGIGLVEFPKEVSDLLMDEPRSEGELTELEGPKANVKIHPRLFMIEEYEYHIYRIAQGPGQLINTFSLFPGEETEIELKTYREKIEEQSRSECVLDEETEESAGKISEQIRNEQEKINGSKKTNNWDVKVSAKGQWGFGGVSGSGGKSGSSTESRKNIAKALRNIISEQTQKEARKRKIEIETTKKTVQTDKEESRILRQLKNINLKQSLNFEFRQVVEHYVCILQLVGCRFVYLSKDGNTQLMAGLPQVETLVTQITEDTAPDGGTDAFQRHNTVMQFIQLYLENIKDFDDNDTLLIEADQIDEKLLQIYNAKPYVKTIAAPKMRIRKEFPELKYVPKISGEQLDFPMSGIPIDVQEYQLNTDGTMVRGELGNGDALDDYSEVMQIESNKTSIHENKLREVRNQFIEELTTKMKDSDNMEDYVQIAKLVTATINNVAQKQEVESTL